MSNELISVNITTHNRAHLLPRCIDSILAQSYKNIELVVVDDFSSDDTLEVIKKYQEKDDRIEYYRHEVNKGNANSRNTALEKCNGYYVAFMDDDDEWIDIDKLKKQIEIFQNSNNSRLAIVCSGIVRHQKDGNEIKEQACHPRNIKNVVLKGGLIHNSTVLTKRNIMKDVGGFDLNVERGVDSEFFRRVILMHDYEVFFMRDITCRYYENCPNRMTALRGCQGYLKHLRSQYVNIKKYFKYLARRPLILLFRVKIMIVLFLQYIKCRVINGR
jgi:glycosyltransferase involved in cell wall biosynthesis